MRKLGPWRKPFPSPEVSESNGLVRYPEPLDGRVWSLDGTPRWTALVASCCAGQHFDWSIDRSAPPETKRDMVVGTVRTSFEDAQRAADAKLVELGFELV